MATPAEIEAAKQDYYAALADLHDISEQREEYVTFRAALNLTRVQELNVAIALKRAIVKAKRQAWADALGS